MALDREKLKARLRAVFAGEAAEHVMALNRDLLLLEKARGEAELSGLVQLLFRTAHTLKGAARSVTATPIEKLCHELETVFGNLRAKPAVPPPAMMRVFFETADALDAASKKFATDGVVPDGMHQGLLGRLARAARGELPVTPPPVSGAAPAVTSTLVTHSPVASPGAGAALARTPLDTPVIAPEPPAPLAGPVSVEGAPEAHRSVAVRDSDAPEVTAASAPETSLSAPPLVTPLPGGAPNEFAPAPLADSRVKPGALTAEDRRAMQRRGGGETVVAVPREAGRTVRVSADTLDALMLHAGELLVARRQARTADQLIGPLEERLQAVRAASRRLATRNAHLAERRARVSATAERSAPLALSEIDEQLELLARDLDRARERLRDDRTWVDQVAARLEDAVRVCCLQPFSEALSGLDRIVRDLASEQQKDVELELRGAGVPLDRGVLNRLRPALQHLVRNAVDHGIEPAGVRAAAGKPARARLTIDAQLRGSQVEVTIADDGGGIDRERVLARARALGIPIPPDESAHLRLVFHPGLSTAERVSEISGRGVGLDVVNSELEAVHGRVEIRSERGVGTIFRLMLPVSLSTFRVLVVEAAGRAFGIVTSSVERLLRANTSELTVIQDRSMLIENGQTLQVAQLAVVLGLAPRCATESRRPLVILTNGEERCALAVDALVAEQEIVLKPLGARLAGVPGVAGAAVLPDGRVCLILTAADLMRQARAADARSFALPAAGEAPHHLIVADDSVTTRQLLRSVLEEAGYVVTEAVDGQAALELLEARGADLVVSDVEMPRMDGLTLTRAIRRSTRFKALPVILITSLESESQKLAGLEAGATAYLKKSAFDQDALLETLAQLL